MSGANIDVQTRSENEATLINDPWAIEIVELRRAARLLERIQVKDTPWPAAMHLGTALDALKAAERLMEQRPT